MYYKLAGLAAQKAPTAKSPWVYVYMCVHVCVVIYTE